MTRPLRDLVRDLRQIHALAHAIDAKLGRAHASLRYAQPGYPPGGGGGGGVLNDDGKPAGLERHLFSVDRAAAELRLVETSLQTALNAMRPAYDVCARWSATEGVEGAVAPLRGRTASGGECVCCGAYCSGAANERLRSGLCNACRLRWMRSGAPDRGEWLLSERARLAEGEGEGEVVA